MPGPGPDWPGLVAWIERLILNYGGRVEEESCAQLKAHVIGVGPTSPSQTRGSDDPTGLLFLSDGALQIPAVLTAAAWEHVQEQEDREALGSLLNTTVLLRDFRLRFHMAPEPTRSRFFLSVGELATTAAGPVKDNTPCCTTLPSVRTKICATWRALLDQGSQGGQDLSELLGEWQHDCVREVLEDVGRRLRAMSLPPAWSLTGWDLDRVRFKGQNRFPVPVQVLCVPDNEFPHFPGTGIQMDGGGQSTAPPPPAEDPQSPAPRSTGMVWDRDGGSPVQLGDIVDTGLSDELLSNPWDKFPPPSVSSSPDPSPEMAQQEGATSHPDPVVMATSTQLPSHCCFPPFQQKPSDLLRTQTRTPSHTQSPQQDPTAASDPVAIATSTQLHRSRESSSFPPFQQQPSHLLRTSPVPPETPVSNQTPTHSPTPQQALLALGTDGKRKQCEVSPEEEPSRSPPSWLFSSQTGASWADEDSGHWQTGSVPRTRPGAHGDGRPFRYSYHVSGQNLQDLSRLRVGAAQLQWAVRYLLTPRTGGSDVR